MFKHENEHLPGPGVPEMSSSQGRNTPKTCNRPTAVPRDDIAVPSDDIEFLFQVYRWTRYVLFDQSSSINL